MLTDDTPCLDDVEHDERLENNCVRYLSFLEQQIESLDAEHGDPLGSIRIVGEMLAETIDFTTDVLDSGLARYETVLAERLCEQIDRFQLDHRRNWLGRLFNGKQHRQIADERCSEVSRQFLKLLQSVLRRAEQQFRDPRTAGSWSDSFEVLKGELSQRW